eukprot:scaffold8309_cov116-Isochrysis_galbana.AAC.1
MCHLVQTRTGPAAAAAAQTGIAAASYSPVVARAAVARRVGRDGVVNRASVSGWRLVTGRRRLQARPGVRSAPSTLFCLKARRARAAVHQLGRRREERRALGEPESERSGDGQHV